MILAAKCAETELQALEDFAATIFNYFKSNSAVFFPLIIFKKLPLLDRMPTGGKKRDF